jgi:hypothetical protein
VNVKNCFNKDFDAVKEKDIEKYLVTRVRAMGGQCPKFNSEATRYVPDRICIFPEGLVVFVECKRPGKGYTDQQAEYACKLHMLGAFTALVDTKPRVDQFISTVKEVINARRNKSDREDAGIFK